MGKTKHIVIGATGDYYADGLEPIYGVWIKSKYPKDSEDQNKITEEVGRGASVVYQYNTETKSIFNSIQKIETKVGESFQQIGATENLISNIENAKEEVTYIGMSNYFKRPVERLYYKDIELEEENIFNDWNSGGNFRNLIEKYEWKFSWDPKFDDIPLEEDSSVENEFFDDKESMLYSPFSLYILKDDMLWINGIKTSMSGHLHWDLFNDDIESTHAAGHLFERYYIDRYINSRSPQEELELYSLAYQYYLDLDNSDEDREMIGQWLEENPLYVLDAWTGDIHKVGESWLYQPHIIYNGEEIDLREIERYELNGLEPKDTLIAIGNGVWADIYYQEVIKTYSFEEEAEHYADWKLLKNVLINPPRANLAALDQERKAYKLFNIELQELIDTYSEREV